MQTFCSLSVLLLVIATSCQRCHIKPAPNNTEKLWADVLAYAQNNLPREGTLVQEPSGYAYVKVDDRYITDLFSRLKAEGFERPPFFRRKDSPGAHISVIYEDEHVRASSEVGQTISFILKEIVVVDVNKKLSFIVMTVDAPALEKIRVKYGLKPKLKNHEFHITIAKRTRRFR